MTTTIILGNLSQANQDKLTALGQDYAGGGPGKIHWVAANKYKTK